MPAIISILTPQRQPCLANTITVHARAGTSGSASNSGADGGLPKWAVAVVVTIAVLVLIALMYGCVLGQKRRDSNSPGHGTVKLVEYPPSTVESMDGAITDNHHAAINDSNNPITRGRISSSRSRSVSRARLIPGMTSFSSSNASNASTAAAALDVPPPAYTPRGEGGSHSRSVSSNRSSSANLTVPLSSPRRPTTITTTGFYS